jgi:hypothetical protein
MTVNLPSFTTISPQNVKAMVQLLFDTICHLTNHIIIEIRTPGLKEQRISISIYGHRRPTLYCTMKQSITGCILLDTLL